jgi:hypothetical protein
LFTHICHGIQTGVSRATQVGLFGQPGLGADVGKSVRGCSRIFRNARRSGGSGAFSMHVARSASWVGHTLGKSE